MALSVEAIPLDVGLDFAIPLGLLVNELVTNSLKHAFPEGKGEIDVNLSRDDNGALVLVVADNGKDTAATTPRLGRPRSRWEPPNRGSGRADEGTIMVESKRGLTRSESVSLLRWPHERPRVQKRPGPCR